MLSSSFERNLHQPLLFIDKDTRVVIQGIGNQGQYHSRLMREYGTKVVGAVHPKKAGKIIAGLHINALFIIRAQSSSTTPLH